MFDSSVKRLYPKVHSTHVAAYLFLSSSVFNSGKWCWYSFHETSLSWIMLHKICKPSFCAHFYQFGRWKCNFLYLCIFVIEIKTKYFIWLSQVIFWQLHVKIIPKGTFNSCGSLSLPCFTSNSTSMDLIFMVLVHKLNVRQVAKVVALFYNI